MVSEEVESSKPFGLLIFEISGLANVPNLPESNQIVKDLIKKENPPSQPFGYDGGFLFPFIRSAYLVPVHAIL